MTYEQLNDTIQALRESNALQRHAKLFKALDCVVNVVRPFHDAVSAIIPNVAGILPPVSNPS